MACIIDIGYEYNIHPTNKQDVVISSKNILHPVKVQYAWQSNQKAPLYNKEGLPLIPFNENVSQ